MPEGKKKQKKQKTRFNLIIQFLSCGKETLAESLLTNLWEAELRFILDVYSCMTHQGACK